MTHTGLLRPWLALLIGALAGALQAQPAVPPAAASAVAALPPVAAYFSRPAMAQPRLSPSGRWLALLVRGPGGRNVLGVLDVHHDAAPVPLARFSDVDIREVHWLGDDRLLFNTEDLEAGSGDRSQGPGLFTVRVDGRGLRPLVRTRFQPFAGPPVRIDRLLSPNHVLLQVPPGGPEVVMGELRADGGRHLSDVVPFWLNVETQVRRPMDGLPPEKITRWWFDPAGQPRLAASSRDGRTRLLWRGPGQAAWTALAEGDALAMPWQPVVVGADGALWVTRPGGPGGVDELTTFDFATGQPRPEPRVRTHGFDFAGALLLDPADGRTLGVRVDVDAETTVWFDPVLQALQAEVDQRLPGRVNRLSCRQCGTPQQVAVVQSLSDADPGHVLLWGRANEAPRLLSPPHEGLPPTPLARLDLHRIRARDGLDLPVWLTRPRQPAAGALRPAVLLVHGGPWARGGHWGWQPLPQFLASRGYVVIEPEFRGSTGYGAAHFRAGWRQWGRAMQDDLADALAWAVKTQGVDPARVCIAGASYGGYAALMGPVHQPGQYRCVAAWLAVTDPLRLLAGSWWWSDDVSDEARAHGLPRLVGDAQADRVALTAVSPLAQAARIDVPVLLAYGGEDKRVPLVHGSSLRAALTEAGRPPEWLLYDDEGHGWRTLAHQRDFAQRLEVFFAQHLAPRAAP